MSNMAKIIKILDPQAGTVQESVMEEKAGGNEHLFENAVFGGQKKTLMEAAMNTADFPQLLRDGIKTIAFDRYTATPTTYQAFVDVTSSDKQSEDWIEESHLGEFPIVGEGNPVPITKRDLDRTINIRNYKREVILEVTEEMLKFNRTNLIKRDAALLGRAAASTREQTVYSVLTDTNNYTRTTAAGDNDIGNNTGAVTFSASGLNTALNTLRTMKDRKSGQYLGVMPDTLIVAPRLEMAAKQLLLSPALARVGGNTTNDVYGGGVANPFRGMVNQIIVSPRLGTSYQWSLMEAKQAIILQVVEDFQIFFESAKMLQSESWFNFDVIRYKARDWFGAGFLNDRFAFYSSSTSAPTVD